MIETGFPFLHCLVKSLMTLLRQFNEVDNIPILSVGRFDFTKKVPFMKNANSNSERFGSKEAPLKCS